MIFPLDLLLSSSMEKEWVSNGPFLSFSSHGSLSSLELTHSLIQTLVSSFVLTQCITSGELVIRLCGQAPWIPKDKVLLHFCS